MPYMLLLLGVVMLCGCEDSSKRPQNSTLAPTPPAPSPANPAPSPANPAPSNAAEEEAVGMDAAALGPNAPGELTGDLLTKLLHLADANKTITYGHLKKNADRYEGKAWAFTGRILEIAETKIPDSQLTVSVGRISIGYDKTMYFLAPFTTEFIENNAIDVAGFLQGNYSYTSQAGWNITIPMIAARAMQPAGTFRKIRAEAAKADRVNSKQAR